MVALMFVTIVISALIVDLLFGWRADPECGPPARTSSAR